MNVTLLLDVEDIVAPEADDIARDIATLLAEEGVRGTFCIVGERVRQWRDRGRSDVIDALRVHDVGTHTDFHSVPPTVVSYLQDKGWDDGVEEAIRRERPAIDAIRSVLGVDPSCWGGPGNSWGPQINEAMRRLGVPAIVYSHTRTPSNDPHEFLGVLCYPTGFYAGDGAYHDRDQAAANLDALVANVCRAQEAGRSWVEVFLGHPTRVLHHEFWDGVNFSRGASPPTTSLRPARRKSPEELRQALASLRATVRRLKALPGVRLLTIAEMNQELASRDRIPVDEDGLRAVLPVIEQNVRGMQHWVILPPDTDVSRIWALTLERLGTLQELSIAVS